MREHLDRPRLLHVSQPTTGGTAVMVRELADEAVQAGYAVTVASPREGELSGWARQVGAHWMPLPMSRERMLADLYLIRRLRQAMASADVVHLHSSKAGALGRLAALGRPRPPIVFTPHAWSWYVGGERSARLYQSFERWAARRCDVITVTSARERSDGIGVLGAAAPIRLIENGVDTAFFTPDGTVAPRSPAPLVVCVGRLCDQKGQDRLLHAVRALPDDQVRVRLVGDGPDREPLRRLAVQLGLGQRLEFVAPTDPRPHLRAADVVVLPSRWEGMSLVLLEAMACGSTVVSTDCGGSEAVNGVGLLVPAVDDAAAQAGLTAALTRLLADAEQRRVYATAARARAVARYSIERVRADFIVAWQQAVSSDA
jgi:glycosyltransferase involved in cell wall biosynthesis